MGGQFLNNISAKNNLLTKMINFGFISVLAIGTALSAPTIPYPLLSHNPIIHNVLPSTTKYTTLAAAPTATILNPYSTLLSHTPYVVVDLSKPYEVQSAIFDALSDSSSEENSSSEESGENSSEESATDNPSGLKSSEESARNRPRNLER